jgi:hypothetical protein
MRHLISPSKVLSYPRGEKYFNYPPRQQPDAIYYNSTTSRASPIFCFGKMKEKKKITPD